MSATPIRELVAKAMLPHTALNTFVVGRAKMDIAARCSPETMLRTVQVLEVAAEWLKELADEGDCADWVIERHNGIAFDLREALALLNGEIAGGGK